MRPRKIQDIEEYEDIQDIEENWYIQEEAARNTARESHIARLWEHLRLQGQLT